MLLKELFDRLATGELSQHTTGRTGVIDPTHYPAIITQLNMGLTSLHTYFPLIEKEVFIQQYDHITEYQLNSKYALSNEDTSIAYKWIIDSPYLPFLDDVIRIESVYDELGIPLPLNDRNNPFSVYTSYWDTLQIPYPIASDVLSLVYRAKHVEIPRDADPETTEVSIPPVLEEALQCFVAGRMYVSLGNAASAGLSAYYSNRYDERVRYLEHNNILQTSTGESNIKLTNKGFI